MKEILLWIICLKREKEVLRLDLQLSASIGKDTNSI